MRQSLFFNSNPAAASGRPKQFLKTIRPDEWSASATEWQLSRSMNKSLNIHWKVNISMIRKFEWSSRNWEKHLFRFRQTSQILLKWISLKETSNHKSQSGCKNANLMAFGDSIWLEKTLVHVYAIKKERVTKINHRSLSEQNKEDRF